MTRHLRLIDAVAIFVGIILGSGIFVAPAGVAGVAPGRLAAVSLWAVGALIAFCGALTYAECGARMPRTGGFYIFYLEVYGEPLAFVGGWAALLVTYPASIAAIARILADYLGQLLPVAPDPRWLGSAAIVLAAAINVAGVRSGPITQRILTSIKLLALVALCLAALVAAPSREVGATAGVWEFVGGGTLLLGALVGLLWTYDGWSDVTLVAGEVRDPRRNIGRAVTFGLVVLFAVYAAVQWSVQTLLPASRAAASDRVVAEAVEAGLGPAAAGVVAALIVVSTFGSINGIVLSAGRIGYAMARHGTFFSWFGAVHPRFATPARSIAVLTLASLVHAWTGTFDQLIRLFSFSIWIFYGLTAVALLVLRRRRVGEPIEFRIPGGVVAPFVVLAVGLAMTIWMVRSDPQVSLRGAALLALGFPLYALWRRLRSRLT